MNREQDELIPFQQAVNVNLFFPGAQRRELLDEIKKAIAEGVAVLSVVGDEGTGKTMLCRMVEKELPDEYVCVYLPENPESFDDVVRILAREAGIDNTDELQSIEEIISALTESLRKSGQRLVVIFDQAERMYLAMLERLRKLLDRINTNENILQLIFAGRQILLENLDQLAICDFADAAETHYYLDDLDASETYAYLNHCARQRSRAKGKSIFTPEASKKIFSIGRGNLKTTNLLAAKAIESADAEGSFVVAPRNVNIKELGLEGLHESFLAGVRRRSGKLIFGSVLLLLSLAAIVWFTGGDEKEQSELKKQEDLPEISAGTEQSGETISSSSGYSLEKTEDAEGDEISEEKINESSIIFTTDTKEQADQLKSEPPAVSKEENKQSLPAEKPASSELNSSSKETIKRTGSDLQDAETVVKSSDTSEMEKRGESTETITAELGQMTKELHRSHPEDANKADSKVNVSQLSVKEEVDSNLIPLYEQPKEEISQVPAQIKKQEKKIIIEPGTLLGQAQQNVSPVFNGIKKNEPKHPQTSPAPKKLFKVAQVKLPMSAASALNGVQKQPALPSDTIYDQRAAAGKALFLGGDEGRQTIQIMALTGEQAEKNLRERFSRKEYQQIADNLYILKSENNSTLFVFYGVYPDKESANKAREQLPSFLGKNEPYVISILEAQSKATFQQQ